MAAEYRGVKTAELTLFKGGRTGWEAPPQCKDPAPTLPEFHPDMNLKDVEDTLRDFCKSRANVIDRTQPLHFTAEGGQAEAGEPGGGAAQVP